MTFIDSVVAGYLFEIMQFPLVHNVEQATSIFNNNVKLYFERVVIRGLVAAVIFHFLPLTIIFWRLQLRTSLFLLVDT